MSQVAALEPTTPGQRRTMRRTPRRVTRSKPSPQSGSCSGLVHGVMSDGQVTTTDAVTNALPNGGGGAHPQRDVPPRPKSGKHRRPTAECHGDVPGFAFPSAGGRTAVDGLAGGYYDGSGDRQQQQGGNGYHLNNTSDVNELLPGTPSPTNTSARGMVKRRLQLRTPDTQGTSSTSAGVAPSNSNKRVRSSAAPDNHHQKGRRQPTTAAAGPSVDEAVAAVAAAAADAQAATAPPPLAMVTSVSPSVGVINRPCTVVAERGSSKRRMGEEGYCDAEDMGGFGSGARLMGTIEATIPTPPPSKTSCLPTFAGPKRGETSLGILTQRFVQVMEELGPNTQLDLNRVAQQLGVKKRRMYDITNVLEGIGMIEKQSKNNIVWLGRERATFLLEHENAVMAKANRNASSDEELEGREKLLDESIAQLTSDLEQMARKPLSFVSPLDFQRIHGLVNSTVITIKAPDGTRLEVPDPDEGLPLLGVRRYQMYLNSDRVAGPHKAIDVVMVNTTPDALPGGAAAPGGASDPRRQAAAAHAASSATAAAAAAASSLPSGSEGLLQPPSLPPPAQAYTFEWPTTTETGADENQWQSLLGEHPTSGVACDLGLKSSAAGGLVPELVPADKSFFPEQQEYMFTLAQTEGLADMYGCDDVLEGVADTLGVPYGLS